MPCEHSHENEYGVFTAFCQFLYEFHENELIDVDGKKFCLFHAPLEDGNGNPTEKKEWTDDRQKSFYSKIKKLCKDAIAKQEYLDLSGIVFPSGANFRGMEFPDVDFSYTQFNGGVDFRDTRFRGKSTRFYNTRFGFHADFTEARFYDGIVTFRNAQFEEIASFEYAEFNNTSPDFLDTQFNWTAQFENAKFNGETGAGFNGARFGWEANFRFALFNGNADFPDTRFNETAIFRNVRFKSRAIFQNAQFKNQVKFQDAKFNGYANFTSPGNNDDADAFQGEVDFSGAEFLGEPIFEVTFENRTFKQKTSFRDCTFEKAPRFHGCSLHQDTDFTDAKFLDRQGDEATKAYRTLKLDMEGKRAREEHLMFYALEMESRQRTTKRKLLKFISWLYGVTADYGQSIISPFASAFMVFVLSMIVYSIFFLASPKAEYEKTDILVLTSRFSLEQIIRPFRALENSPSLSEFIEKASPSNLWRLCLGITTTLQSVLSFILLGLGALAARWRFKIG